MADAMKSSINPAAAPVVAPAVAPIAAPAADDVVKYFQTPRSVFLLPFLVHK
jgi:hypothetical protein